MKKVLLTLGVLLLLSSVGAVALDSEEASFLSQINQYRNTSSECYDHDAGWMSWPQGSVRNLSEAPSLSTASDGHNLTMINNGCFSHQCAGEPAFDARANSAGYTGWTYLSENIAYGTTMDAFAAFEIWRNSTGHNQNMLSCRARAIGIAREFGNDLDGWRWTTMFGDVIQAGGAPAQPDPPAQDPPPQDPPPADPPPQDPPPQDPPPQDPPAAQPPTNSGSGPAAYDSDNDCFITGPEFFVALDHWLSGVIDDITFFSVSDAWIGGLSVCTSAAASNSTLSIELSQTSRALLFSAQGIEAESISVEIYSLNGTLIATEQSSGSLLRWNMRDEANAPVANGVYFYRLSVQNQHGVVSSEIKSLYVLR